MSAREPERLAVTVWLVNPDRAAATVGELLDQTTQPRVLAVAQGASPVDVGRFEDLTRGYGHRFFHWVFAPPLASLAGVWNLALRFAASGGFDPRVLVCNDDIRLRPDTMEVLTGVWERAAAPVLVSGVGRREDTWEEDAKVELDPAALLSARGGPDFSCFMTTPEAVEELGWFDEGFTPAYCEDLDFHRRVLLAGKGGGCFSVALPYLHQQGGSGTLKFMSPEQRARREQAISAGARTHYAAKWGGGVNEEKWFTPLGEGADEEALREVWGDPRTPAMFGRVRRCLMGCTDEYGAEREVADPHLCQEGCGTVLANPDLWPPVCEECWEKESRRDEENRRLSISADLERRAEDE